MTVKDRLPPLETGRERAHVSGSTWVRLRPSFAAGPMLVAAFLTCVCVTSSDAQTPVSPGAYEYVYPYNTPDLIENHYVVLDAAAGEPRGWYYGTSDEFDAAREGYLPGFFVAPMEALRVTGDSIFFRLTRPERFFVAPVPLEYRDSSAVPPGMLEVWSVQLPTQVRDYAGSRGADGITLTVPGGPRVFRLMSAR